MVCLTDLGWTATAAMAERMPGIEAGWAERVGADRYAAARAVLDDVTRC